ncbi:hypothetical protein OTSGILL_2366 [Orientia tsutsugamushi str. Gilliam]|uniref:Uncharacterized protein n=1 Tax=Orientia tsutsugamushi str. Gilliam TaxID=1359184 RepID=A0A0F3M736_ORITS|nr:hypothetical protein OTSGILL_2366 [Orientia tsutsugamushi str. Gilliam]
MLCTVIVSLLHSYFSANPSLHPHYWISSLLWLTQPSLHHLQSLMFHHLYFEYLLNYVRVIRTSQVVSLIFTNSLTPRTPVVENFWIFTSLTSNLLLPTMWLNISASTTSYFRGYHVHHLVSARMFHCLRFTTVVTFSSTRLAIWWI